MQVHYFSFPHLDRDRAELWWEACNRSDRKLPDEPDRVRMLRICQLHFEDNCFHVQLQEKLMGIPQKRRLKRNLAMPTKNGVISKHIFFSSILLDFEEYLKKLFSSRKRFFYNLNQRT